MEDESQINWRKECLKWKELCVELLKEVEVLKAEIKHLKEQLGTNSKNSSKAPSQDPNRPKSDTKPSGRKQGGQPGHQGHNRSPVPPDQVTKMVDLVPSSCPNCDNTSFDRKVVSIECRQVVDLPIGLFVQRDVGYGSEQILMPPFSK